MMMRSPHRRYAKKGEPKTMKKVFTGEIRLQIRKEDWTFAAGIAADLKILSAKFRDLHTHGVSLQPVSTDGVVFPIVATDPKPGTIKKYGLVEVGKDSIDPLKHSTKKKKGRR
jgi:hypothetical protein